MVKLMKIIISNYKFLLKNNQFHIESNYNLSCYQELNDNSLAIFHLKKILIKKLLFRYIPEIRIFLS